MSMASRARVPEWWRSPTNQPLPDWPVDIDQSAHFGGEMRGYVDPIYEQSIPLA
jgi:hypothetical protein